MTVLGSVILFVIPSRGVVIGALSVILAVGFAAAIVAGVGREDIARRLRRGMCVASGAGMVAAHAWTAYVLTAGPLVTHTSGPVHASGLLAWSTGAVMNVAAATTGLCALSWAVDGIVSCRRRMHTGSAVVAIAILGGLACIPGVVSIELNTYGLTSETVAMEDAGQSRQYVPQDSYESFMATQPLIFPVSRWNGMLSLAVPLLVFLAVLLVLWPDWAFGRTLSGWNVDVPVCAGSVIAVGLFAALLWAEASFLGVRQAVRWLGHSPPNAEVVRSTLIGVEAMPFLCTCVLVAVGVVHARRRGRGGRIQEGV